MPSSPVLLSVDQSVHAALECRRYILPRLGTIMNEYATYKLIMVWSYVRSSGVAHQCLTTRMIAARMPTHSIQQVGIFLWYSYGFGPTSSWKVLYLYYDIPPILNSTNIYLLFLFGGKIAKYLKRQYFQPHSMKLRYTHFPWPVRSILHTHSFLPRKI